MRNQVRKFIKQSGLKQSWIAAKLGVSAQFFSMYLNGTRELATNRQEDLTKLMAKVSDIINI